MAGVYISYPFCSQKCSYCNFASGVFSRTWETDYIEALRSEILRHSWQWTPETVYIGGGTPSRMSGETLASILELIPGRPWKEATIEAAPGGLSLEMVRAWRQAGVTRVSLGVQSFVKSEIARTGRKHSAEIVREEVALLRELGILDLNIDLIAGLAGQTRESWEESLYWIEELEPSHVSVYMLEVDRDSRLGKELLLGGVRYGARDVPSEEDIVAFYERAVERLAAAGRERYEISNFARPGCASRHNLKYWKLEPYIGFGADAHSFDGLRRWQNLEETGDYLSAWREGRTVRSEETLADRLGERMYVGLRLMEGVELTPEIEERYGEPIRRFAAGGLLALEGRRVKLTNRGVLLSNEVFQEFVAEPACIA